MQLPRIVSGQYAVGTLLFVDRSRVDIRSTTAGLANEPRIRFLQRGELHSPTSMLTECTKRAVRKMSNPQLTKPSKKVLVL